MRNSLRYIINACPYDYLSRMQKALNAMYVEDDRPCVINMITGKELKCKYNSCDKCLQEWLNEDETESNYM